MIKIVEEKDAKFITHAGSVHADDVNLMVLYEDVSKLHKGVLSMILV